MRVVVDDKIPFIREPLDRIGAEAVYRPGSEIGPADVRDADALIVRTRTRCNEALLGESRVRFVGTATIGYDHLDTEFLERAGIAWSNCPGCNASSVGQYVRSCLLLLERDRGWNLSQTVMGLVGVGHVGTAVAEAVRPLGVTLLLNDPPQQVRSLEQGLPSAVRFVGMEELQEHCDVISFHTPLVSGGAWPTYHLADTVFFRKLKRRPLIVNTSRGEVVDNDALIEALRNGTVCDAIVDTWEHEPHINLDLLRRVYIGTPHVAGYSADGKANATRMVMEALCRHFHIPVSFHVEPPALPGGAEACAGLSERGRALFLYNPLSDSERLKKRPECFEELRGNYPLRRETCV